MLCVVTAGCGPGRGAPPPDEPTLVAPQHDAAPSIPREPPWTVAAGTFDVAMDSALVWMYAPEPTTGRVLVESAYDDSRVGVFTAELTEPARTATVEVTGLQADYPYRYRVQLGNGMATDWYYFRTPPPPDADVAVHFLVGADIINDPQYHTNILDTMAGTGASFYLSLGDWPYTDIPIRDTTAPQYRASHRIARLRPTVEHLLRAMPVYAIYDDHEIRDNWDAGWAAEDPERFTAGITVWDEFFPVRGAPERRYRSTRWGMHVEVFILDTRLYRTAYRAADGSDKTMLGAEQLAWLKEALVGSDATFKLIACTVPLGFGTTEEHWNAYAVERDELLAFIAERAIPGVVWLTGDQHWFAAHHHDGDVREFQVGPVEAFLRDPPTELAPQVVAVAREANYGEVIVTPGPTPYLTFTARGLDGRLIYAETLGR